MSKTESMKCSLKACGHLKVQQPTLSKEAHIGKLLAYVTTTKEDTESRAFLFERGNFIIKISQDSSGHTHRFSSRKHILFMLSELYRLYQSHSVLCNPPTSWSFNFDHYKTPITLQLWWNKSFAFCVYNSFLNSWTRHGNNYRHCIKH